VLHDEHPARTERTESQLEQPVGKTFVRACQAEARRRQEAIFLAQIDREALRVEQLADTCHRGWERMGERKLRDRLSDDGEQRAAPLERELDRSCVHSRAQGVRRTDAERGKRRQIAVTRLAVGSEEELERTDRRL